MSDTPRTDVLIAKHVRDWNAEAYPDLHFLVEQDVELQDHARTLERELAVSRDKADALNIVLAVVSSKAGVEAPTLREMIKEVYEELKAKRWLS